MDLDGEEIPPRPAPRLRRRHAFGDKDVKDRRQLSVVHENLAKDQSQSSNLNSLQPADLNCDYDRESSRKQSSDSDVLSDDFEMPSNENVSFGTEFGRH